MRMTMMSKTTVHVSDHNMLREMLVTKAANFQKPKEAYETLNIFGESILTALNQESWKKHHKICSPGFSPRNLNYMCKVAVQTCDLMFERWNKQLESEKEMVLNVGNYSDITLDILGKVCVDGCEIVTIQIGWIWCW